MGERQTRDLSRHGADIDDATTPTLPHAPYHLANAAQSSEVVGLHGGPKFLHGKFLHRALPLDSSIVDQNINVLALPMDCREAIRNLPI